MDEYLIYVMNKIKGVVYSRSVILPHVYYTIANSIVISSSEMDYNMACAIQALFVDELKNWKVLTYDDKKCCVKNDNIIIDIKQYQRKNNLNLLLE